MLSLITACPRQRRARKIDQTISPRADRAVLTLCMPKLGGAQGAQTQILI
jgi:hypothetical protein